MSEKIVICKLLSNIIYTKLLENNKKYTKANATSITLVSIQHFINMIQPIVTALGAKICNWNSNLSLK